MLFNTVYGEAIQRILGKFGATDAAIIALEVLIQTAEGRVKQREVADLAKASCRGLHMDKPGSGVVCAKCFTAAFEKGAREKAMSGDELAAGKKGAPVGIVEVPPEEQAGLDREEIAAEVQRMLGGSEKKS